MASAASGTNHPSGQAQSHPHPAEDPEATACLSQHSPMANGKGNTSSTVLAVSPLLSVGDREDGTVTTQTQT